MNNIFTTPCYMFNNPDVWKSLDEIGYKREDSTFDDERYLYVGNDWYGTENEKDELFYPSRKIFCGNDIELFLAIAALRNDSDIYQYFIINNSKYFKSLTDNVIDSLPTNEIINTYRKATAEELFKIFS